MPIRAVIDTNIIMSGLRSRNGASNLLLQNIEIEGVTFFLSTPLVLEYEKALLEHKDDLSLSEVEIGQFLDALCLICRPQEIYYLWRPLLKDPKDDMVLELAVSAQADFILTYNKKDFVGSDQFGIVVLTPKEFLMKLEVIK